jgi:hypothetical protein
MKPEYIPLLSGFIGTILGAIVSLASVWLQQRAQERRDRGKLALDAAIKEYESAEKYAEFMAKQGQQVVTFDLGYYIVLHSKLAEFLLSGHDLTKESWVAAHKQAIEISEAGVEFYKRRKADQSKQSGRPT